MWIWPLICKSPTTSICEWNIHSQKWNYSYHRFFHNSLEIWNRTRKSLQFWEKKKRKGKCIHLPTDCLLAESERWHKNVFYEIFLSNITREVKHEEHRTAGKAAAKASVRNALESLSAALQHSESNLMDPVPQRLGRKSSMQWFVGFWWRHATPNSIVKGTYAAIDQNVFVIAGIKPELSCYYKRDSCCFSVIWGQNKLSRASDSWFSRIIFTLGLTCLFNPVDFLSGWQLKRTVGYYPQGCVKIPALETRKAD